MPRGVQVAVAVPYLLTGTYALKLGARGETYDTAPQNRNRELLVAGPATFYTVILGAIANYERSS